jgi:hypothetical protein
MDMRLHKGYNDPAEYQSGVNNEIRHSQEFKKSIFFLKQIFPAVGKSLECQSIESWQRHYLTIQYKKLKKWVDDLLTLKALSHLAPYYPKLPFDLEPDNPELCEHWYWEDLGKFNQIIQYEFDKSGATKYPVPAELKQALTMVAKLISSVDIDREELDKIFPLQAKLIIHRDGRVHFHSITGDIHETKFKVNSNSYLLLSFLAHKPNETFRFGEIAKNLKQARRLADTDKETRVRNTVKEIRKKLILFPKEMFKVDKGFGLNCKVIIKE